MSVQLYTGSLSLVRKSGVGQAVEHQREMLRRTGISTTDRASRAARVVHCNTVFPDSVLAALWSRLWGKKVVFYGHSTMEDFRDSFRGSNQLAPLFRRWIQFCYNSGNVIITPTEYSRQVLLGYGVRKPVYALSNGVDTDFFAPSAARRAAFRKKYSLGDSDKAVLSVGHFIARKGLLEFVELARSLPEVRFFWFGYTNLELVPNNIRQAIAAAPDNLVFPGFVGREELREAYCGCDVFAFLSHEETEGIVVLEALACGIPTVLRDIPVYHGWLHDGVEVYQAARDDALRRRVVGLLDGTLPSLAEAGLGLARSRSMDAMGQKLREIYQRENLPYQAPKTAPLRRPVLLRLTHSR
ncbi:MAG: glycosyltransferase [Oscillibacter sp.]